MILVETEEGPAPCPDTITIIGGGRWARVLVEVLCRLVPPSVAICVYSRRNTRSMGIWGQARGLANRVELLSTWPRPFSTGLGAVVVANAARDHETAVEWALLAGAPVMVEKPIALTGPAAERLADLARQRNVPFAAAHVFLFARYLDNFWKLIRNAGRIDSLHVDWADPESEERYGESKRYDPGLPVFADWLPHVVSIVGSLASRVPDNCRILEVRRGGAAIDLELM